MRPKLPHQEYRNPEHDAQRITRLGTWLQEHGIDELPQFINILKGEMTLIAPRAPMETAYESIARANTDDKPVLRKVALWRAWRLTRLPGITGFHQLLSSGPEILDCDISYLNDDSWHQYWNILRASFFVVPFGKSAVRG